jgi:DNA-binding Lrp family transcriptional regulator
LNSRFKRVIMHQASAQNQKTTNKGNIDSLDYQILNILQQDSRLSFNRIADKVKTSVGTAYNRVRTLEAEGIVKGYTILVDSTKLGYALTALIFLQVNGGHLREVEEEIAKADNVIAVYDITGEFDAIVIAKFKDRDALNLFIKRLAALPYVNRTVTSVSLNVPKEENKLVLQKEKSKLC